MKVKFKTIERAKAEKARAEARPKLRVWWIPQVPMKSFEVPVKDIQSARLILDVLAHYDLFQFANKIKHDYSNAGGLSVWEDGEWCAWQDEDGCDIDDDKYEKFGFRPTP